MRLRRSNIRDVALESAEYKAHIIGKLKDFGLSEQEAAPVSDYITRRLAFLGHPFSPDSSIFAFHDKIKKAAELLEISESDMLNAAIRQPPLFTLAAETVHGNAEQSASLLGISKQAFIRAAMKQPSLLYQSPDTTNTRVERAAALLGLSKADFVKACQRQPAIFCLTPEKINGNIESAAALLEVPKADYIRAAQRQPSLFSRAPAKINENIEQAAGLLGITKQAYLGAALSQASLFTQKAARINQNVETGAQLLGISKEDYVKAALKLPTLFYRSPAKINRNVEDIARAMGMGKTDALDKVIARQPSLMTQAPETIVRHARMIRRFEDKGLIPVPADALMQRSPGLLTLSDDNFFLRRAYAAVTNLENPQTIKLLKDSRRSIERAFVAALGHDPDVTVITATKPWKEDVQTEEDRNLRTLIANIQNGLLSGYEHTPELAEDGEDISWEEMERILFEL